MNETVTLILVWLSGVVLGAIFFGGLWWTVSRGVSSKRPALLFLGSQLLRTGIALVGFYFVSDGHWERLLLCLLGFVMVRWVVTLSLRSGQARLPRNTVEINRHSGMDRRNPDCREANNLRHPWSLGSGDPCRNDGDPLNSTALRLPRPSGESQTRPAQENQTCN